MTSLLPEASGALWTRKLFWSCVAMVLWGYTVAHYIHGAFGYRGYGDFFLLMRSVREWLAGGRLDVGFSYLHPPFFYLLNIPLALLRDPLTVQIMVVVNQLLLVACMGLLSAAMSPKPPWRLWGWLLLPLALNFRPLLYLLSMAKIELLQVVLLLGTFVSFQRNRPWIAGGLMAFSGMVKPLPLILVLYWAWKRQWRVVGGWTLATAFIVAICSAVIGAKIVWTYFMDVALPHGGSASSLYWYENQSLLGVAGRLFHRVRPQQFFIDPNKVTSPEVLFGWGLRLVVLIWLGYLIRPRGSVSQARLLGEWSISLAGMLLLSPFSRDYYAVFLVPSYIFLAYYLWLRDLHWSSGGFWLGVVSYMLVGQGFPLGVIHRLPSVIPGVPNFQAYFHYGVPMVGYLLLVAAWARALREGERGV